MLFVPLIHRLLCVFDCCFSPLRIAFSAGSLNGLDLELDDSQDANKQPSASVQIQWPQMKHADDAVGLRLVWHAIHMSK